MSQLLACGPSLAAHMLLAMAQHVRKRKPGGTKGKQEIGQAKACPFCGARNICMVHRSPRPWTGGLQREPPPPRTGRAWEIARGPLCVARSRRKYRNQCIAAGALSNLDGAMLLLLRRGFTQMRLKDGMPSFRPRGKSALNEKCSRGFRASSMTFHLLMHGGP